MMKKIFSVIVISLLSFATFAAYDKPIFDTHLHYDGEDAQHFTPQQILDILQRNNMPYALVSSTPNTPTEALYQAAPQKIIPFLSIYNSLKDEKGRWGDNPEIITRINTRLKAGIYQGIGEFHLFKQDKDSAVLKELVQIARQNKLMLQVHGDAEVVEQIFKQAPNITILWAHLGTQPEPKFLNGMLQKYPNNLYIDTTVRDGEFVDKNGKLKSEWRDFFTQNASRLLVGVDTFSVNRWVTFDKVVTEIRHWLGQLPPGVADKMAYQNAAGLFLK